MNERRVERHRGQEPRAGARHPEAHRWEKPLFGSLLSAEGWPYLLVPLIPITVYLEFLAEAEGAVLFFISALGIIPAAALMARATEELVERSGPGIGGLMNVTFGNLPELVIAFVALSAGVHEVVRAWVIGSILGNVLLVLGAAMFVGGLRKPSQSFAPQAASVQAMMLMVAGVALLIPAILFVISGGSLPVPGREDPPFAADIERLSLLVALVLLGTYAGGLLFSLRTHHDLFNPEAEMRLHAEAGRRPWSVKKSIVLLAIAGAAVALMADSLVHSLSETARAAGVSEFFIAVIVVAVVGNAAEHWVAILVAYKDKMDLAVNIAIGSSAQVALFVGPLLVVLSFLFGPAPLPLVFNALEIAGVLLAVFIASYIARSGESSWFEGLTLIGVYAILGVTFFFA